MILSSTSRIPRALAVVAVATAALIVGAALPAAPQGEAASGYKLVNQGSTKCLDIRAQDAEYGARAQSYSCHGKPNQRFVTQPTGTTTDGRPTFKLINLNGSHLCLQVRGASKAEGAQVDQRGCSADAHQYWYKDQPARGSYSVVRNVNSALCLTAEGSANGGRILQFGCGVNGNQQWKFDNS